MNSKHIDTDSVRDLYNNMNEIWPENDKWYQYTYKQIYKFLKKYEKRLSLNSSTRILNAGSGGNSYGIQGIHTHVDISERHLQGVENTILASVENLPIPDEQYDVCICVGSVINYCDAFVAIAEIQRVLKKNGFLILDFDQSRNYEFFGTDTYNSNLDIIETFNSGYIDKIWVYSETYIDKLLNHNGLRTIEKKYYHTLSCLAYRLFKNEQKAAKYACVDKLIQFIPKAKKISNNIILIAQKF